jgi:parvulin-like peptidyl-prolyl isomerase
MPRHAATLLAAALLFVATCSRSPAPATPPAPNGPVPPLSEHQLRDRVVAVVDDEAVLWSEIEAVVALGLVPATRSRADVLDGLIEQRLRFQAAERFGPVQVSVERVEEQVAEIAARFESPEAFQRRLEASGFTEAELRQLVVRQLMVLNYVDEQLGARVFVSLDDIRTYFDEQLVPRLERTGDPVPPLDTVREDIRGVLKEERLNEEIERWTSELRLEADVQIFLDEEGEELPPLVWREEGTG